MNRTRTFMLMVGLTVLFVLVGGAIGGRQGVIWAFILAAGMNFYSYWFSDKLVLTQRRRKAVLHRGRADASCGFADAQGVPYTPKGPQRLRNGEKPSPCGRGGHGGDSRYS